MSQQKPKYAFTERFTLNNGETKDLNYGKVGGRVDDDPYPLEQAVAEVLKAAGIKAENIDTLEAYEKIGDAPSQLSLLGKTLFGSVLDRNLEGLRSLLGEVRRRMI